MKKIAVYRQLEKAKAKIANSQNWARHAMARDKYSKEVNVTDHRACRFCSVGALAAIGVDYFPGVPARELLDCAAGDFSDYYDIVELNDNTSHKTVMKVWDRAIELAYKASKKKAPAK